MLCLALALFVIQFLSLLYHIISRPHLSFYMLSSVTIPCITTEPLSLYNTTDLWCHPSYIKFCCTYMPQWHRYCYIGEQLCASVLLKVPTYTVTVWDEACTLTLQSPRYRLTALTHSLPCFVLSRLPYLSTDCLNLLLFAYDAVLNRRLLYQRICLRCGHHEVMWM